MKKRQWTGIKGYEEEILQGVLYLSMIRDLYDNSIVAYKTGTERRIRLVLDTIRAAKRKEKVTMELQLRSTSQKHSISVCRN